MDKLRCRTMHNFQRARCNMKIAAQRQVVKVDTAVNPARKAGKVKLPPGPKPAGPFSALVGGLSVFALPLSLHIGSGMAMAQEAAAGLQDAVSQLPVDSDQLAGLGPFTAAGIAAVGGLGYMLLQKGAEAKEAASALLAAKKHASALQASVDSLQKRKAEYEAQLQDLTTQLSAAQTRVLEQEGTAERQSAELAELRKALMSVEAAQQQAMGLGTQLEQQLKAAQDKVSALASSLAGTSGRLQEAEQELARTRAEWAQEKSTLDSQMSAMADVLSATTKELDQERKTAVETRKQMGVERARAARLQDEVAQLQKDLSAKLSELQSAVEQSNELRAALEAAKAANEKLAAQRKESEELYNKAEWRAAKLEQELSQTKQQLEEVEAVRAALQNEKGMFEADLLAARAQVQEESAAAASARDQFDRVSCQLDETEAALQTLKTELHDSEATCQQQRAQVASLTESLNSFKLNHDAVSQELAGKLTMLREVDAELEKQREKSLSYRADAEQANAKNDELQQQLAHLQAELANAQAEQQSAQALASELGSLRSRVSELEQSLSSSEEQLAAAQEENGRLLAQMATQAASKFSTDAGSSGEDSIPEVPAAPAPSEEAPNTESADAPETPRLKAVRSTKKRSSPRKKNQPKDESAAVIAAPPATAESPVEAALDESDAASAPKPRKRAVSAAQAAKRRDSPALKTAKPRKPRAKKAAAAVPAITVEAPLEGVVRSDVEAPAGVVATGVAAAVPAVGELSA